MELLDGLWPNHTVEVTRVIDGESGRWFMATLLDGANFVLARQSGQTAAEAIENLAEASYL